MSARENDPRRGTGGQMIGWTADRRQDISVDTSIVFVWDHGVDSWCSTGHAQRGCVCFHYRCIFCERVAV